jgi:predicted small metal-binding protein
MKEFACGDVVPGCKAKFKASSEEEVLEQVADHAKRDHGIAQASLELVKAVRDHIHTSAA